MKYAVASGKGGTGKTMVTAALSAVWDQPHTAVDLDVEEPNLHLFLKPEIRDESMVTLEIPVHDPAKCSLCGECAAFCQYKALALMGKNMLIFPEMCHGCGGCLRICPEGALSPGGRELGRVVEGRAGEVRFLMGCLRVGEAMSPPLMRHVKERITDSGDTLMDSPPGVSCPAMNAVLDADVIVLVTEPTPFGLYDFRLAVEAFAGLVKPLGAVINRVGIGDDGVERFCSERGIPVWARIPHSLDVARAYSRGDVISVCMPELREVFTNLRDKLRLAAMSLGEVGKEVCPA